MGNRLTYTLVFAGVLLVGAMSPSALGQTAASGSVFKVPPNPSGEEIAGLFGEARAMLWGYWRERRSGQVTVEAYSREGELTTSSYRVERDDAERWRITVQFVRRLSKRPRSSEITTHTTFVAYSVRRIQVIGRGDGPLYVSDDVVLDAVQYRLVLESADGNVARF